MKARDIDKRPPRLCHETPPKDGDGMIFKPAGWRDAKCTLPLGHGGCCGEFARGVWWGDKDRIPNLDLLYSTDPVESSPPNERE